MTVKETRERAKALKVKNYARLSKEQLIWAVQLAEGNADCYRRIPSCGQNDCCWRADCQA